MGIMTFLDPPRHDTKITIKRCAEFGVTTKMITGDHKVRLMEPNYKDRANPPA